MIPKIQEKMLLKVTKGPVGTKDLRSFDKKISQEYPGA